MAVCWSLFCFTAGISASTTVTGDRGSSVEIRCSYDSGYETNMKYLCRGACSWGTKDIPVESGSTAKDQRFSLKDDTAARVFTVTITDLRSEDAGQYWCVIQRSLPQRDVYTEILLLVKLGESHTAKINFNSYLIANLISTLIKFYMLPKHLALSHLASSTSNTWRALVTVHYQLITALIERLSHCRVRTNCGIILLKYYMELHLSENTVALL
uniref:Ig-like domain-containing protein n=1 Tax=Astyanax mexicanus TaxID=7994 RepID=A0A3B1J2K9_ASTMX